MTNSWTDIRNTDLVIVMGGNAAEAHPCGFKWVTEAKANRGARLIVVDPRFTRTASVADVYAPIRQGSDIAFLLGVINYCIQNGKVQWEYVKAFTNAPYLVKDGFAYKDGLFTGYDEAKRDYDRSSWGYQIGPDGYVIADDTLEHPRCVWNLLKAHVAQYTPELVERICGTPKDKFLKVAAMIAETSSPTKAMTSMYALGWTQHSKGSQNIRTMAMLQLVLGNVGVRGGGMNALRGHSNIQGLTDVGLMSQLIPGYLAIPTEKEKDFSTYMSTRAFKPLRPKQTSYWQNYKKFFVSFQKTMWGAAATPENDFAYDWLPKLDVPSYDVLRAFELMHNGKMNGYFCQGFNPLLSFPNRKKVTDGLAKLKFLVIMDPLDTETANFWQNHGAFNDVDPSKIQTEVIQLPTTCFAEDEGSTTNSGRWLQWHWAAGSPPGEARNDIWIMAQLFLRLKALYEKEGGALPDPIVKLNWPYKDPGEPTPAELAREINGNAITDLADPNDPTKIVVAAGKQLPSFAALRDDGSTACGCWIYSGCFTEAGNQMARRDNSDPEDAGVYPKWSFSWPVNRRILYNRASCDLKGQPWDPSRKIISWDGTKWTGLDVPDIAPTAKPDEVGPFIMNAEGTARLFALGLMKEGPFPVHYEPFEFSGRQRHRAQDQGQSGGAGVRGRRQRVRRRQGVPLCRHLVPVDRAFPFLDKARVGERRPATGILRRDLRRARQREGHPERRLGESVVEAGRSARQGPRHQAHPAAPMRRQDGPRGRRAAALGIHGPGEEGLRPKFADARGRRRQLRDAGVQGVPGQHRAGARAGRLRRRQ